MCPEFCAMCSDIVPLWLYLVDSFAPSIHSALLKHTPTTTYPHMEKKHNVEIESDRICKANTANERHTATVHRRSEPIQKRETGLIALLIRVRRSRVSLKSELQARCLDKRGRWLAKPKHNTAASFNEATGDCPSNTQLRRASLKKTHKHAHTSRARSSALRTLRAVAHTDTNKGTSSARGKKNSFYVDVEVICDEFHLWQNTAVSDLTDELKGSED